MECLIGDARDAVVFLSLIIDSLNGCRVATASTAKDCFTKLHLTEEQERAGFRG